MVSPLRHQHLYCLHLVQRMDNGKTQKDIIDADLSNRRKTGHLLLWFKDVSKQEVISFNISLPPNQSAVGSCYMWLPWFITKRTWRKYKYWESTTILISVGHAGTWTIYGCVCFLHLELCSYMKFCIENQWSSVSVMLMKTWLLYANKCHLILMNNNVVETKFKQRSQSLLIMVPAHVSQIQCLVCSLCRKITHSCCARTAWANPRTLS